MMQVNNEWFYEDLTPESAIKIVELFRNGKEPLKVETSFFQKIKEKFSGYFSADDHEPEPKMIEMVSVLGSKVQDNEIPVDPIGEQARVIISDEIV
jgi:hypothetical protein